jgi:hypothetical protein
MRDAVGGGFSEVALGGVGADSARLACRSCRRRAVAYSGFAARHLACVFLRRAT